MKRCVTRNALANFGMRRSVGRAISVKSGCDGSTARSLGRPAGRPAAPGRGCVGAGGGSVCCRGAAAARPPRNSGIRTTRARGCVRAIRSCQPQLLGAPISIQLEIRRRSGEVTQLARRRHRHDGGQHASNNQARGPGHRVIAQISLLAVSKAKRVPCSGRTQCHGRCADRARRSAFRARGTALTRNVISRCDVWRGNSSARAASNPWIQRRPSSRRRSLRAPAARSRARSSRGSVAG